jgi:hypothetical protein
MSELERVAEALWRHEVADLRAARATRDTMLFSEQSESIQQKWRGFAAAALAAARPDREGWPSKETIAREIRRAMLDNPTDAGFNARAEKREKLADAVADVIFAHFGFHEQEAKG